MVGSAVATMVWSSAPRNIASMMPSTIALISGWVSARGSLACGWCLGAFVLMRPLDAASGAPLQWGRMRRAMAGAIEMNPATTTGSDDAWDAMVAAGRVAADGVRPARVRARRRAGALGLSARYRCQHRPGHALCGHRQFRRPPAARLRRRRMRAAARGGAGAQPR